MAKEAYAYSCVRTDMHDVCNAAIAIQMHQRVFREHARVSASLHCK